MRGYGNFSHDQAFALKEGGPKIEIQGPADVLLRVTTLVGEIEALKRERHKEELLSSRMAFASAYFRKRQDRRASARPAPSLA